MWVQRIIRAVSVWACVVAALAAVPAVASAGTQYWVTGKGWGHGIGLSQYGAQGFATKAGFTYDQIVRYYYQGTTVGTQPAGTGSVNVLLTDGRPAITLETLADGMTVTSGGSTFTAQTGDLLVLRAVSGGMQLARTRDGAEEVLQASASGPVTVSAPAGAVAAIRPRLRATNGATNHRYRGSASVHRVGSSLSLVNTLPMEQYLLSVVPAEMPASWHIEALKAQSVVARSYAVATRKTSGIYDQHADTRSQMYRGYDGEDPRTTAAIQATAGQVVFSGSTVVPTFFFSTSGGRTASIQDVWNSSPRSYLVSVPDPYEKSPYSNWPEQISYTPAQLARKLSGYVPGSITGVQVPRNASQRAARVILSGPRGTREMSASLFQYRLGLRSTFFRVLKLQLNAGPRKGSKVRLSGVVPTTGTTYLMVRTPGADWARVGKIKRKKGGAWSQTVRVPVTREFRLQRGTRMGPGVVIRVP